ncbi:hypothetical protein CXB51_014263 [Gossypium anomalum]|uniref:Zinc knuckle CX2CX4HX4C domain-containing protein n=1 Tax=Gossypium anomalum TaxID=47600 RepID=A0A8J5Z9X4_9ROSI|nr:hypothetical protein CXB51_014263 [Gossypium anomalum]
MEKGLEELRLDNEEEDAFSLPAGEEAQNPSIGFCLVGCFLTASVVNFRAMRNTLANLWHPLEGVQISDLGDKRYLLQENEDPMAIPLMLSDWWVQVHDLPPGFHKESMAMQFGNFLGKFLEYDMKNLSTGYWNFMRIQVQIDVRKTLKRKKKIMLADSAFTYANFKYEKLTLFCFLCGCLGHGDSFCPKRLQWGLKEVELGWDLSLRAQTRRTVTASSIWLKEESDNSFGKKRNEQQLGPILRNNYRSGSWADFNSNLGINLEGSKSLNLLNQRHDSRQSMGKEESVGKSQQLEPCQAGKGSILVRNYVVWFNGPDMMKMDCELEEEDSLDINGGQSDHFEIVSVATSGYAVRKP